MKGREYLQVGLAAVFLSGCASAAGDQAAELAWVAPGLTQTKNNEEVNQSEPAFVFPDRVPIVTPEPEAEKVVIESIPTPDSTPVSEVIINPEQEIIAWGQMRDASGRAAGERMRILGADNDVYLVEKKTGEQVQVPIDQMLLVEGYPWKEVITDERFGVRLDKWQLTKNTKFIGAGRIRTAGPIEAIGGDNDFERMITESEKNNFKTLVVFNPTFPREESYYRERIRTLLSEHPGVTLELGNEPGNKEIPFWQGDWNSFAKFFVISFQEIKKINPNAEVILAATVNPETDEMPMLTAIKSLGFDLNSRGLIFGVHGYSNSVEIQQKVVAIRSVLSTVGVANPRLVFTELGIKRGIGTGNLINMVATAFQLGVEDVYLHELVDWEGWGLVSPGWDYVSPEFVKIAAAVRAGWK